MSALKDLVRIVIHPRRTCREILKLETLNASLAVVLAFGAVVSLLFLRSHLARDYPPPPDELETWIETWGEFPILPYVKIPAERYRLAQAIFMVPLSLAVWILMAGSARVLSVLFGGRTTYVQYANMFGHSFYAFWFLATILDGLFTLIMGDHLLRALRMEYGPLARAVVANYPSLVWTSVLGLGAAYNGILAHESDGATGTAAILKAAAIAVATGSWPIVLITLLLR
jgi:hypothetical protein